LRPHDLDGTLRDPRPGGCHTPGSPFAMAVALARMSEKTSRWLDLVAFLPHHHFAAEYRAAVARSVT